MVGKLKIDGLGPLLTGIFAIKDILTGIIIEHGGGIFDIIVKLLKALEESTKEMASKINEIKGKKDKSKLLKDFFKNIFQSIQKPLKTNASNIDGLIQSFIVQRILIQLGLNDFAGISISSVVNNDEMIYAFIDSIEIDNKVLTNIENTLKSIELSIGIITRMIENLKELDELSFNLRDIMERIESEIDGLAEEEPKIFKELAKQINKNTELLKALISSLQGIIDFILLIIQRDQGVIDALNNAEIIADSYQKGGGENDLVLVELWRELKKNTDEESFENIRKGVRQATILIDRLNTMGISGLISEPTIDENNLISSIGALMGYRLGAALVSPINSPEKRQKLLEQALEVIQDVSPQPPGARQFFRGMELMFKLMASGQVFITEGSALNAIDSVISSYPVPQTLYIWLTEYVNQILKILKDLDRIAPLILNKTEEQLKSFTQLIKAIEV